VIFARDGGHHRHAAAPGLTLPILVRALGLRGPDPRSDALQAATVLQTSSQRALAALPEIVPESDAPETVELVRAAIAARPDALWEKLGAGIDETPSEQYRRLRLTTLGVERDEVLKIRSTGTIDHDVIEQVLGSFDIEESMLTVATERADGSPPNSSCPPRLRPGVQLPASRRRTRRHRAGRLRGLPGLHPGGHPHGAPEDLPDLRKRRML
jgi:CPA1 family monovalent cation:H+ antiporter